MDVDETCARAARGADRDHAGSDGASCIKALGRAVRPASRCSASLRRRCGRPRAGRRAAGHRVRVRRRLEEVRHHGVRRAVHQADRHPGGLPGPLHVREAARHARGQGQQIDVVSVQGGEIYPGQAHEHDHAARLSASSIARCWPSGSLRHGNAIGGHTLSHVVCYNKKKWPGEHHPKSWADFWDVQKFPGRRVLRREEIWAIEAALRPTA